MDRNALPPPVTVRMPQGRGRVPWRELWRYRDLLWMWVRRDFTVYYKQTLLGPLWYVIQPLLTMAVFTLIFHRMADLSSGGAPAHLFNLVGVILWGFFRDTWVQVSETFHHHRQLFAKVYFPRLIVPMAQWITGLIRLAFQWGVLLVLWGQWKWSGHALPAGHPAWFLFSLAVLSMTAMGGGLMMASLIVKYRDLRFLTSFGMQLLMFLSAVFYMLSEAADRLPGVGRWLAYNPVAVAMEAARVAWLGVGEVPPAAAWTAVGVGAVWLVLGVKMFSRAEKDFLDTI